MGNYKTEKRKNKELTALIATKEAAMQAQIELDTYLRRKLATVTHWLGSHSGIAPAPLENHMKIVDKMIEGLKDAN